MNFPPAAGGKPKGRGHFAEKTVVIGISGSGGLHRGAEALSGFTLERTQIHSQIAGGLIAFVAAFAHAFAYNAFQLRRVQAVALR